MILALASCSAVQAMSAADGAERSQRGVVVRAGTLELRIAGVVLCLAVRGFRHIRSSESTLGAGGARGHVAGLVAADRLGDGRVFRGELVHLVGEVAHLLVGGVAAQ